MDCESLLGGFVSDRARRCEIIFPEGETTTFGFEDCEEVCCAPDLEFDDSGGETLIPSVGVGGVMKVVGALDRFDGAASWVVTMRFRAAPLSCGLVDCASSSECNWGGEAWRGASSTLSWRFFPPKSEPMPPPLVFGLAGSFAPSGSPAILGEVALRAGAKASLSLPTGETARLFAAVWMVLLCSVGGSSAEVVAESVRLAFLAASTESIVSEAMRGEERVRRPAWDWCGDMPGRLGGWLKMVG